MLGKIDWQHWWRTMVLINIQDDIIRLNSMGLLNKLLIDKTTQKNIMWATDAYAEFGPRYERNEQIQITLFTEENKGIIKTRARKEFEQQSKRTRQRAEVFTPLWICNYMNNYVDEQWFGRQNAFNKDGVPTDKVLFDDKHSWKDYIDLKQLEITCGEAPYLVSRYDVASGEIIPISRRIGILDRKIRVVTENTTTYEDWIFWVTRAYQATYGYEFQGDNLLIARINLLMTLFENAEEIWHKQPSLKEINTIINIITWNLWQMDGITGTIPFKKAQEQYQQLDMFSLMGLSETEKEDEPQPLCKIYDWRSNKSLTYESMKEKRL